MKKLAIALSVVMISCTSQQFQDSVGVASEALGSTGTAAGLTNGEVISGLKEALEVGAQNAVGATSIADGFWKNELIKIAFPEEAIKVKNTLVDLGMNGMVENFEMTMNRAAEEATKEAVPVFVNAIKGMSIGDGFAILKGATSKVELTKAWKPVTSAYNTATILTGGNAIDPDLNAYVTNQAIDGLFKMISNEENKIRKDPLARTSDLLKKVFSQQN